MGFIPGWGRSPGGGQLTPLLECNPLQEWQATSVFFLENPMDRGASPATWSHRESDMTEATKHACMHGLFWCNLALLPGKSHGRRSLVGCSPWGLEEWDTTEQLHFHFSLSCIGEGNGNPLLCSCLENPRDGGAWWAAVYGVTQSQTWLKGLSNSSSSLSHDSISDISKYYHVLPAP